MPWYLCEYEAHPNWSASGKAEPGAYSSDVWAKNRKDLERVLRLRGMGEVFVGTSGSKKRPYALPSKLLMRRNDTRRKALEVVHSACFLAYILAQSKTAPPYETVGDEGIVHNTVHALLNGYPSRKVMAQRLAYWEREAPGYYGSTIRGNHG